MKLVLCSVLLLSVLSYSQALDCYVCTGTSAGDSCGEVYVPDASTLTTCTSGLDQCYKYKTSAGVVTRSCTNAAGCTTGDGWADLENIFGSGASADCCTTDMCNSAPVLQMTSVFVVPILAFIYMLF